LEPPRLQGFFIEKMPPWNSTEIRPVCGTALKPRGKNHPQAANGLHWRGNRQAVMPVAQLTLELRIEHAHSLKDRRQVVRSIKDQLRQGFNVSVAEMDEAVTWQSATIGVVAVSRSRDYLHGLVEEVERAARRMATELGADLSDSFWDYLES
jgi:uncharacterized protein